MTGQSMPRLTTAVTVERGPEQRGGWSDLVEGPGEEYQARVPKGHALACMWHVSDVHLCDAESPARLEYLDRYSDPDSPYREALGDVGTYRPQEILTVQVALSMVETVNAFDRGPTTGRVVDAVVLTGDLTDNAQTNELQWCKAVLRGGAVAPRSGSPRSSSWVGVSDARTWDDRYWHPDGPPAGFSPDRPSALFGYPTVPGLIDAARADVTSPGLRHRCIAVYGNHDGLLQGTVPADAALRRLARGTERIAGLPLGSTPLVTAEAIQPHGPARYPHEASSPRVTIAADEARAIVEPGDFARILVGSGKNYYGTDVGEVRLLSLDTVNPHGGWQGSLDPAQFEWLANELVAAAGRYVVIASHHPSPTLTNDYAPGGAPKRVLGPAVVELLLQNQNVIGWMAGHVHHHAAMRHGDSRSGFWEFTTASLIDWPQQARLVEIVQVSDEGEPEIAIITTVADHAAGVAWQAGDITEPAALASVSRALSGNDYRLRGGALRGLSLDSAPAVRNTVWRVPDPFAGRAPQG
jgi:metallophosphoesterase (TIGR03767 family)